MRFNVLTAFLFAGLTAAALPAKAELVTYQFTAVVTSASGAGLTAGTGPGTAVTGSFVVDDSTPAAWANSTTASYLGAVQSFEVQVGADTLALASGGGRVVVEDYLAVSEVERAYTLVHTGLGDSLTLNGAAVTSGFATLDVLDIDPLAAPDNNIDSFGFPDFSALSLEDFGSSTFSMVGSLGSANFRVASNLTSLTRVGGGVATVPELDPASASSAVALVAGAASTLRTRRRRA